MSVGLDPGAAEARIAFLLTLRSKGLRDTRVLGAFETVPRARFVPQRYVDLALTDVSLPLACGQTTLAPSVMAEMITALELKPEHRVLEIGAGSGYGAAILARLAKEVVSLERYRSLAIEAQARLRAQGVENAVVHLADGRLGWPEGAPYDRILIHAAVEKLPPALVSQLAPTGRIIAVERGGGRSSLSRFTHGTGLSDMVRVTLAPLSLPLLMEGVAESL
ncbi:protein-L-isoaspartate(D-aspartate) O-methyltransferase [Alsobacter soli]|uniref:Protein-L-isoaspartate O-methyltransferase n=1 Tax=Alsobacter soli TaxID=2109933 RepID=A0A2T1HM88_9HYPH|nr:protein-L-isoaspartate(D-aspartate) O-methyltransferase [Alsobacter soli]PSC02775.1 protein-L-isoaspartate(D-aspartate) O-methyltransferase [Alsobacter soli]